MRRNPLILKRSTSLRPNPSHISIYYEMKNALSILFLTITSISFGQTIGNNIKFNPLPLIDDISFPTIQGGIELKLSKKMSFYNEVGIKYRKGEFENSGDSTFLNSKGIKFKTEIRYNIIKESGFLRNSYLAFNLFATRNFYNDYVQYVVKTEDTKEPTYYYPDNVIVTTDAFGVRKSVWGFNLVIGKKIPFHWSKKLFMDFYAGAGIRFVDINTTGKKYNKDIHSLLRPRHPNINYMISSQAADQNNFIAPNLTAGIRFCYSL